MPRGNDSQAALSELADKFGDGVGRAEALIEANRAAYSPLLRAAQIQPSDPEAKKELEKSDVAKSAGLDEKQLLDFAVKGAPGSDQTVVVVYADETGRTQKDAFPLDVVGKAPKTVEKAVAEAEGEEPEKPKRSSAKKKS